MASKLFVLDFDHSLVSENTDIWVLQCLPHLKLEDQLRNSRKKFECWTDTMNEMMKVLHANGCSKDDIVEWMKKIKPFQAIESFLKRAKGLPLVDVVIISDANTVFIKTILEEHNCLEAIKEIHCNPGEFNNEGRLVINRYHSHTCARCANTPNICKGTILKSILSKKQYDSVVYVGDGRNDVCPCLMLTENDHVIAREGYSLARCMQEHTAELKAKLHVLDFTTKATEDMLCSLIQ